MSGSEDELFSDEDSVGPNQLILLLKKLKQIMNVLVH